MWGIRSAWAYHSCPWNRYALYCIVKTSDKLVHHPSILLALPGKFSFWCNQQRQCAGDGYYGTLYIREHNHQCCIVDLEKYAIELGTICFKNCIWKGQEILHCVGFPSEWQSDTTERLSQSFSAWSMTASFLDFGQISLHPFLFFPKW